MDNANFSVRHRWDSRFWALFVASSWLVVLIGFWPPVSQRLAGHADYAAPPILQLHVFVYTGWMLLLTVQPALVALRRVDWHRRVGLAGIALAVLVPITGIVAEVYSQRFYAARDPENVRFFIIPVMMAVGFAIFAALAILARRVPATHKRAMFLATAFIVTGPYARSWGSALEGMVGPGPLGSALHWLTGLNVMLAGLVIYDLVTRRAVHPLVRRALMAIIPMQFAVIWTWYSDWWPPLVRQVLAIAPA
jgi:hypothetical protein